MDEYPITVEGKWTAAHSKLIKNKLQIHFQSKKKSDGGECRVQVADGDTTRATIYFKSPDVRDRVLARGGHEMTLVDERVVLSVSLYREDPKSLPSSTKVKSDDTSGLLKDPPGCTGGLSAPSGSGRSIAVDKDHTTKDGVEAPQSVALLLENVPGDMCRDFLLMLLDNVSGLKENEGNYGLEVICETNNAVMTFRDQSDAKRFLTACPTAVKFTKHGMTARRLERTRCIRVEDLDGDVAHVKDMLGIYFENDWALPSKIDVKPEEQAAIVTFSDTKIAETIPKKKDHILAGIPIKVYPYYVSMRTALYGKDRPTWKMPDAFTESIHYAVWKFLLMKNQSKHLNDQLASCFCSVDMDKPEVRLSPLPILLRQKSPTGRHVDEWKDNALAAFRQLLAPYTAFECIADVPAWRSAEGEVRLVVKEDGVLLMDASRGVLTVAGGAEDMRRIRGPVESIVQRANNQMKRQREGESEDVLMPPAKYYILQQEGLQRAASDISPEMLLSYREDANTLTLSGLPEEVLKAKYWILERENNMSKRPLDMDPHILDFLKSVDCMEMSQDLFTSQGIRAVYNVEGTAVFLMGSSDSVLADAETKLNSALLHHRVVVTDQEVLRMPKWTELNKQLVDSYNSSKKKTVAIQSHTQTPGCITVYGFVNPVKEVSQHLEDFIASYSRVQKVIYVKSHAVMQFIQENKSQEWARFATEVMVRFDPRRRRINITGAGLYVQKANDSFQRMAATLPTDYLTVHKPGAKKYFLELGSKHLDTVMKEHNCVVILHEDKEEEEDDDDDEEEDMGQEIYCEVRLPSGILVSVRRANICRVKVDAVVNAGNEELKHSGGVALALLKAAGPQLQKLSDDLVAKYGPLQVGDAMVTDSCKLPCSFVIHTVGPKYSDHDQKTAVSLLKLAVKESLRTATEQHCSTVALPALSSGVYGFPLELCAETIAKAVHEYTENNGGQTSLTEIHLVDINENTVSALARAVSEVFTDLHPRMTIPKKGGDTSSGYRERGASGRGGNRGRGKNQKGGRGRGTRSQGAHQGHLNQERGGYGRGDQQGILEAKCTQEGLMIVLREGNIQDQLTDVIVNTIADNGNLSQGAVAKAILSAAGPQLQAALYGLFAGNRLTYGNVVVTDGYNLKCQKVFHAVCPFYRAGQAEEELKTAIRFCLDEAERLQLASLSFPALGTGNLGFPKALVARMLLEEIQAYSRRICPQHLGEVAIVVHPSDSETVACFTREFKGMGQTDVQQGQRGSHQSSPKAEQPSASFGKVSSPSPGAYRMQIGQLTLEVSSGDITKETSDAIVNASNNHFNLKSGVSKAILESAGSAVEIECLQIVKSPGFQNRSMIITSAGLLPCRHIIHVIGQNEAAKVKDIVYSVLKMCEERRLTSVAFPALGTGQGGLNPSAAADAMIGAVVDFVRKKHQRFVNSVKILVFQAAMVKEFHMSMTRREGQEVEEKTVLTKIKDTAGYVKDSITSLFKGPPDDKLLSDDYVVLEVKEFEPAVFELCADNSQALRRAKNHIKQLIVTEQKEEVILDKYISLLSTKDKEKLKDLHRKLSVNIRLEHKHGQDSLIHLEGLTKDVLTADGNIRDLLRGVERRENQKQKALLVSGLVQWQYQLPGRNQRLKDFDTDTNYKLEEAFGDKQSVDIEIDNNIYTANVTLMKAVCSGTGRRHQEIELMRKDLKGAALPSGWEDMTHVLLKPVTLIQGSQEYQDVDQEFRKTGLANNIISIERIQNKTLWQHYQLIKEKLELKNRHTNNEKRLFHGTSPTAIDHINNSGFNRSYAGMHGALYGNGSYFAVDSAYSQRYAMADPQGHKRMYLARVLVGDYTQGRASLLVPPAKHSGNSTDLYDSVCDNVGKPSMFVIFNDVQAYPEYLITFM